jgi:hypothetical protein
MKKLLFIIIVIPAILFGQYKKGQISFTYNDKTFDLPINKVEIKKDNKISLLLIAEQNDSSGTRMISLELKTVSFNTDPTDVRIKFMELNRITDTGNEIICSYGDTLDTRFGKSNKGERIIWEANSISMKLGIDNVNYKESKFIISGNFNLTLSSIFDNPHRKEIANIKEGKFEIIL